MEAATTLLLACMLGMVEISKTAPADIARSHLETQPDFGYETLLLPESPAERSKRNSDTEQRTEQVFFTFVAPAARFGECWGGSTAGLEDTTLSVQYRTVRAGGDGSDMEENDDGEEWMGNNSIPLRPIATRGPRIANLSSDSNERECVQFRLQQTEHGGGSCNCWAVSSVTIRGTTLQLQRQVSKLVLIKYLLGVN